MPKNRLAKNASSMASAVMISKFLGLFRQLIFAYYFGTSFAADSYNAAFKIANFLRRLFGEGALAAAFVPQYQKIRAKKSRNEHFVFALKVLSLLSLILFILSVISIAFAPFIVKIFTPGFSDETFKLTVSLTRILAPYIFFIGIASMLIVILNSHNYYFIPHSASSLFNLSIILSIMIYAYLSESSLQDKIIIYSLGTLLGGFLQIVINLPLLKKIGLKLRLIFDFSSTNMKVLYRKFIPSAIGIGVRQINFLVDLQLASFLVVGSITALNNAWFLIMLPLSIFAVALGTAAIPNFSELVAEKKWKLLSSRINFSLISLSYILFFVTILIFGLGKDFIRIIFLRGNFDLSSLEMTNKALLGYSSGLVFFGLNRILSSIFYANGDTKRPMQIAIIIAVMNIILNLILMQFFGYVGLAISTAVCGIFQTMIYWRKLNKNYKMLNISDALKTLFKTFLISLFWGIVLFFTSKIWITKTFSIAILKSFLMISGLSLLYFYSLAILKFPHINEMFLRIRKKIRKR